MLLAEADRMLVEAGPALSALPYWQLVHRMEQPLGDVERNPDFLPRGISRSR